MQFLESDLPERNIFKGLFLIIVVSVIGYLFAINAVQFGMLARVSGKICDESCVRKIVATQTEGSSTNGIDIFERPVAAVDTSNIQITPTVTPTSVVTSQGVSKTYLSYKNLSDGGASGTDWTAISSDLVSFDLSLYPEGIVVTLEGWISLSQGASRGFVRLYDVTNARAVDGSENEIEALSRASFYSKPLSIWRGTNQYRLEVKSDTGYRVDLDSVRLVIKKM